MKLTSWSERGVEGFDESEDSEAKNAAKSVSTRVLWRSESEVWMLLQIKFFCPLRTSLKILRSWENFRGKKIITKTPKVQKHLLCFEKKIMFLHFLPLVFFTPLKNKKKQKNRNNKIKIGEKHHTHSLLLEYFDDFRYNKHDHYKQQ